MFRRRHINHAKICEGLSRLATGVARCFWFRAADDRDEIEAAVTLHAIERIDRFKFQHGTDAFAFYTTLIHRQILRQLTKQKRLYSRARLFTDAMRETQSGRLLDPIAKAAPYALVA